MKAPDANAIAVTWGPAVLRAAINVRETNGAANGSKANGAAGDAVNALILDPGVPLVSARALIADKYSAQTGERVLHHHAGVFYAWTGTHYPELDPDAVRS